MAKDATFKFTGKDNVSEALKTINQNVQKVSKATKNAAKSINTFNAALTVLKATVNGIGKIISFALNTIIKAVQAALRTLKNIITGLFKFIKTALSTLLSWTVKALGKVFDGIKKLFTNLFNFSKDVIKKTAQVIKKGIEFIIDSVQGYADDQYNEIQLKVSLGDSFDDVMKSFDELLRYTTASDDELLSLFATFAEVGKSVPEIKKWARATVYVANATGQSLQRISRLLLGQEAAEASMDRTLHRLGINVSETEQSIKTIDEIIEKLGPEMEELSKNSLNQAFANIKNDIATIKDNIGYIFSGPVKYVADKIDGILYKLSKSKKFEVLADKVDTLFNNIKPIIDKIFEFFEKFIQDPKGFFIALWNDIQQIFRNIGDNIAILFQKLGETFALSIRLIWLQLKKIDFSPLQKFGDALESFIIGIGEGFGWFDELDVVEGDLAATFRNAWNKAHPDFQLSEEDKWYKQLGNVVTGFIEDLDTQFVKWWNGTDWALDLGIQLDEDQSWYTNLTTMIGDLYTDVIKPKIIDKFIDEWNNYIFPNLCDSFVLLGEVFGAAVHNFLADSPIIDLINKIPGVNIGKPSDIKKYQESIFVGLSYLGFINDFGLDDPSQITEEWLSQPNTKLGKQYGKTNRDAISNIFAIQRTGGTDLALGIAGTIAGYLAGGKIGGAAGAWLGTNIGRFGFANPTEMLAEAKEGLSALKSFTNVLTYKESPNVAEELGKIWSREATETTETMSTAADTMSEAAATMSEAAETISEADAELQRRIDAIENKGWHLSPNITISGFSKGTTFDIPGFSNGGPVNGPTVALLGENGSEYVLSHDMLTGKVPVNIPGMANKPGATTGGKATNVADAAGSSNVKKFSISLSEEDKLLKQIDENIEEMSKLINVEWTNLHDWWENTNTLDEPEAETEVVVSKFQEWIESSKIGKVLIAQGKFLLGLENTIKTVFSGDFWKNIGGVIAAPFTKDFWTKAGTWFSDNWYVVLEKFGDFLDKVIMAPFAGVGFLAQNGAFGTHVGNIINGSFDEDGTFSIMKAFGALIGELLPYLQKGLEIIGPLFDEAFDIFGYAVQILGERLGKVLLPILDAFIPLMKTLADIVIALSPVVEAILTPAITVIAAILRALVPILDLLMPAFAGIGAVIQWVSEAINWVIGSLLNWLGDIHIGNWYPFAGVGGNTVKKPTSVSDNYEAIMAEYNAAKANSVTGVNTASATTASQTASYNGASVIHIHNDFSGSYVVGSNGFRELALIIKNTMEDLDYTGQTI